MPLASIGSPREVPVPWHSQAVDSGGVIKASLIASKGWNERHKSLVLETSSSLTLLNSIDPLLPSTSQWCKELIHILTRYLMNFHLLRVWLLSPFPLGQDHWELSMMRCDHPVGQTVELEDWQQCKAGNNGANVSTDTLSETHVFPCQSAFHCTCSWKWMEIHGNSTQTNQK